MKTFKLVGALLAWVLTAQLAAQEPAWNPAAIKECDRACLVGIMDGYLNAIFKKDPKAVPPPSIDVRMTENTGQMDVGEGMLWRSKTEPTSFKIYVADPVEGQVAFQGRLKVQGRDNLVAIRLKVDRGKVSEIEQLWVAGIAPQAIELLTTPRTVLTDDVPLAQRVSREVMFASPTPTSMRSKATAAGSAPLPTTAFATRTATARSTTRRPADA